MTQPNPIEPPKFRPELRDFADRIRWVRAFVLRLNSVSEIARRLDYPSQTVESWEKGTVPRNQVEVARRYHEIAPEVPLNWLLVGGETQLFTKSDEKYTPLQIIEEGQQRLHFELPPPRSNPALALVWNTGESTDGDH